MRKVNSAGLNLVTSFEGCSLKVYKDVVGIPTIGYGSTYYQDGTKVTMNDSDITQLQANDLLEFVVNQKATLVEQMITISINDNEFGALVDFCFNLGQNALEHSTLLKLLNQNADRQAVADQFLKWDMAGGQHIAGLTRRREAERALFLQPLLDQDSVPSDEDINNKLNNIEEDIMR